MKDKDGGLYYYPFPENRLVRMYVKEADGDILFRMWNMDDDKLWEEHGWVPHEAIMAAAKMYSGKNFDPKTVYDIRLARALIREEKEKKPVQ